MCVCVRVGCVRGRLSFATAAACMHTPLIHGLARFIIPTQSGDLELTVDGIIFANVRSCEVFVQFVVVRSCVLRLCLGPPRPQYQCCRNLVSGFAKLIPLQTASNLRGHNAVNIEIGGLGVIGFIGTRKCAAILHLRKRFRQLSGQAAFQKIGLRLFRVRLSRPSFREPL